MKRRYKVLLLLSIIMIGLSIPELVYKNQGNSKSKGSVRNGYLENAFLIPYSGNNFSYFSPLSYFIMNNGYTHSKVHKTVLESYKACERSCPGVDFRIMECSDKAGGKMLIHRTHQNGMSVDFMVPKKRGQRQSWLFDKMGMWHYLLGFNDKGQLLVDKNIEIDFEAMAKHLLAVNEAAKNNGLRIRKVIFKIELKDDLFKTEAGKLLRRSNVYFVKSLAHIVNIVHDDHYHVDFQEI